MTPNAASQGAVTHFRASAATGLRGWKPGSAPTIVSIPQAGGRIPKVSLRDISLSYKANNGSSLLALDHISFEVKPSEFLCIVGPSGCGKSTLLHLIAGLQPPTAGQVLVDDQPVDGPGTDRILIFQELGLFPWLTVAENVEFDMKMKNVPKAERQEKTERYLRLVH